MKKRNIIRSLLSFLMISIMILSNIHISNADTYLTKAKFKGGAETDYYIVTNKNEHGSADNPLNYKLIKETGSSKWERAFCIEPGVSLPHDLTLEGNKYNDVTLNRIAYLGYYTKPNVKNYIFTQAMIYENLGNSMQEKVTKIGTRSGGNITSEYETWKAKIQTQLNNFEKKPSFNGSDISKTAGSTYKVNDTNKVLKDYKTFEIKKDGVILSHTKGQNYLNITVLDSSNKKTVKFTNATIKAGGGYKYEATKSVNIVYRNSKQDCFVGGDVDPIDFNIAIIVNPNQGGLKIAKTDENENYVAGVKFNLSLSEDMSNPVGTYTTGKNGVADIDGLNPGKYYIQEIEAPKHLIIDDTIKSIDIEAGKVASFGATNKLTTTYFSKTDVAGEEIENAHIILRDSNNNIFEEWDSTLEDHIVRGMTIGEKYTLEETYAPDGYVISNKIEFVYEENMQKINMIDKRVSISKTDLVNGDPVEGATLQIIDPETEKVIDETTTGKDVWYPSGLEEGKTYILREITAPYGYYVAEDVEFTVESSDENGVKVDQKVEMKDAPILTNIQVNKVDSQTKKAIVSNDFAFTIYSDSKCKEEIKTVSANKKQGTATFKDLRYGTYYIKETQAPKGYELSKEVVKVVIDDKLENVGKTYSFEYLNTLLPVSIVKTGDAVTVLPYVVLAGLALGGFVLLKRKKTKESE